MRELMNPRGFERVVTEILEIEPQELPAEAIQNLVSFNKVWWRLRDKLSSDSSISLYF